MGGFTRIRGVFDPTEYTLYNIRGAGGSRRHKFNIATSRILLQRLSVLPWCVRLHGAALTAQPLVVLEFY